MGKIKIILKWILAIIVLIFAIIAAVYMFKKTPVFTSIFVISIIGIGLLVRQVNKEANE